MSEEIHNAAIVVPRSILTTILLNGVLGFGMMLASLFSLTDVDDALASPTGSPFMQIFLDSTGSVPGAAILVAIVPILISATAAGSMASASRMMWAFARDRGPPGWRSLRKVRPISIRYACETRNPSFRLMEVG